MHENRVDAPRVKHGSQPHRALCVARRQPHLHMHVGAAFELQFDPRELALSFAVLSHVAGEGGQAGALDLRHRDARARAGHRKFPNQKLRPAKEAPHRT